MVKLPRLARAINRKRLCLRRDGIRGHPAGPARSCGGAGGRSTPPAGRGRCHLTVVTECGEDALDSVTGAIVRIAVGQLV